MVTLMIRFSDVFKARHEQTQQGHKANVKLEAAFNLTPFGVFGNDDDCRHPAVKKTTIESLDERMQNC